MKIVAAIYNHQEYYPPTLNAIEELSKCCDKLYLLTRNQKENEWHYPRNLEIVLSGKFSPLDNIRSASTTWKILSFLKFTYDLYCLIKRHKPEWVLCYDAIPLLSFRLISKIIPKQPKLWYHNHDKIETDRIDKYSVSWWALKCERTYFSKIDIFSLPSNERKQFFPLNDLAGKYFFIPNFPSKSFYGKLNKSSRPKEEIKLIYQGAISAYHGIEEVMEFISKTDKSIKLILIGYISDSYKADIQKLIQELGIQGKVEILKAVKYFELPSVTASTHVGLAIHKPKSINYQTAGTASNKIYEYVALGLPVLYYNDLHYKNHLAKYKWALPCNLTVEDFCSQIHYIWQNYEDLSSTALRDFDAELNFEKVFEPVTLYLKSFNH